jgi:hypothetical protein
MQASMGQGRIKLNLLPGTGAQVITRYRARKHEAMLLYWGPDFFDPHSNAKAFAYNVDKQRRQLPEHHDLAQRLARARALGQDTRRAEGIRSGENARRPTRACSRRCRRARRSS